MSTITVKASIFNLPITVTSLVRNIKKQQAFIREHINHELDEARKMNDGTLDESDFKKITGYYGLAVPAILGEAIAALRGWKLSDRERLALTYLGTITGLFDDFFDKHSLDDVRIKTLLEHPEQLNGENASEKLFLYFYKKATQQAHDPQKVLHYFRLVYDAQIESKKQATAGLTREEILHITLHKGAVSVLFYRAALENPFLPGEENAFYRMGGLMQFGNDIFDVYKDRNNGIHTLLTTSDKIEEIRRLFFKEMMESFATFGHSGYSNDHIKQFTRYILLCLCSRCFVCLDQLESKEKGTGNIFTPAAYSRQDLVCDMEKNSNKWKTIRYYLKQRIKIPAEGKLS